MFKDFMRKRNIKKQIKNERIERENLKSKFEDLASRESYRRGFDLYFFFAEIDFPKIPTELLSDYHLLYETYVISIENGLPLYDCNVALLKLGLRAKEIREKQKITKYEELDNMLSAITFN